MVCYPIQDTAICYSYQDWAACYPNQDWVWSVTLIKTGYGLLPESRHCSLLFVSKLGSLLPERRMGIVCYLNQDLEAVTLIKTF